MVVVGCEMVVVGCGVVVGRDGGGGTEAHFAHLGGSDMRYSVIFLISLSPSCERDDRGVDDEAGPPLSAGASSSENKWPMCTALDYVLGGSSS